MRQPFSYYGGKQRLVSKLLPLIPKHTVYVEPFCGGASVFWKKPWPKVTNTDHYREVLNDTNLQIVNFFKQFRDNEAALIQAIQRTPYSRHEYNLSRECYKNPSQFSDLEQARLFYVNANLSFSNKINGGFALSVIGRNHAATHSNRISKLNNIRGRLSGVYIENLDALKCIDMWDAPQSFFYCDPPYPDAHQGHYSGYTRENFQELVDTLSEIQGSFLLSCYDFDGIQVPSEWERFTFEAHCSSSGQGNVGKGRDKMRAATASELGNRKRTEVVYRKINRKVRPELQFLWDGDQLSCFA